MLTTVPQGASLTSLHTTVSHTLHYDRSRYHPTERTRLNERNGTIELQCYSAVTAPGAQLAKRVIGRWFDHLASPALIPVVRVLSVLVATVIAWSDLFGSKRKGMGGGLYQGLEVPQHGLPTAMKFWKSTSQSFPKTGLFLERDHK